jgi:hypothetical protein
MDDLKNKSFKSVQPFRLYEDKWQENAIKNGRFSVLMFQI